MRRFALLLLPYALCHCSEEFTAEMALKAEIAVLRKQHAEEERALRALSNVELGRKVEQEALTGAYRARRIALERIQPGTPQDTVRQLLGAPFSSDSTSDYYLRPIYICVMKKYGFVALRIRFVAGRVTAVEESRPPAQRPVSEL